MTGSAPSAVDYGPWFAQLVQFALEARDSRVVKREAAVPGACTGCRSLGTFVGRLRSTGYWQVSDDLDLGAFRAAATNEGLVGLPMTFRSAVTSWSAGSLPSRSSRR